MTQPSQRFGYVTGQGAWIVRLVAVAAVIACFIASFLVLASGLTVDRVATVGISAAVALACLLIV